MSFQGDVRGIGLAELLQGLARGRKEGVLTLTSRGDHRSVLGMEDGKAWLLPDPDESPDTWRARARDAWADDPTFTMEAARLQPIVKAARLEALYALLDGGGVHFRFDPGPVPDRVTKLEEDGFPTTEIHCDAIPVEFMLLEYARIADEIELAGHPTLISPEIIPCVQDADELGKTPVRLVGACDGNSTIQEIADRLGWPIRQAQLAIIGGLATGGLRIAHPIEVLRLAQHELQRKHFSRAGSRLTLWCRTGTPGPLVTEDAEALANEWLAGRLTSALRLMEHKYVRCLLRRLDATLGSTSHAVVHWMEATRIRPQDRMSRLRLAAMRLRDAGEGCDLDVREILDLARELREHGSPMRSGPALAIAAFLQPAAVPQRLELGMGLVLAGRVEEAGPWVVSACTDMLAAGHADRILGPLRTLIEKDPRNRDARDLLTKAKRQSTRTKKMRRHAAIAASVTLLLGAGAVVKVKVEEKRKGQISEIRTMLNSPQTALAQLNVHFANDTSLEVGDLRRELEDRLRAEENTLRNSWLDEYHAAQKEAAEGDYLLALDMVRALPPVPRLQLVTEAWPKTIEVMLGMTGRMEEELNALGRPSIHAPQQVVVEDRIRQQAEQLANSLTDKELSSPDLAEFRKALDGVNEIIIKRAHERSVAEFETEQKTIDAENDRLLKLARASIERHEYERALNHFDLILANDPTGKVRRVLAQEISETRQKRDAVIEARELAAAGKHTAALERLKEAFEETVRVMLPWQVKTNPAGVSVQITRVGSEEETVTRQSPFVIEGTFADEWQLRFDLPDFDSRVLVVKGPQDIDLQLSRSHEIHVECEGRVDAVPAPIGDGSTGDYIICDRNGMIVRAAWDGSIRWRQDIKTVSGIARRPVPLPSLNGELLFLTETGSVWLLDPKDGHLKGPWEIGEPPVFGPIVIGDEVHAQLRSGKIARWRTSLRPLLDDQGTSSRVSDTALRNGFQGLFTVLRPDGTRGQELRAATADGSGWTIRVLDEAYEVFEDGRESESFQITKNGDWSYVAWESPARKDDHPVLWIADHAGLRAFLPPGIDRVVSIDALEDLAGPPAPEGIVPNAPGALDPSFETQEPDAADGAKVPETMGPELPSDLPVIPPIESLGKKPGGMPEETNDSAGAPK
ncbi:hypothetical protein Poly30_31470 [Planctomycetes bacterium Poly30]|uniref:PatA-like N-terminal domain-containing protein n=1 Tax=Saltatorellus ferox TaxID=2528018 RepID=A0A518EU48_9BACT|nr:hypothetical protein Poly30_31470 [Planctomycetes bacterium Poly30]